MTTQIMIEDDSCSWTGSSARHSRGRPPRTATPPPRSRLTACSIFGFFIGARKWPHSSLSIRHVLRHVMTCSTVARILLRAVLNSA